MIGLASVIRDLRAVESGADAAVGTTSTQRIKSALQPPLTGSSNPLFASGPADAHER
ncbi:hypothetical protein ACGFWI_35630 [Streptomyces sp. NPDC048434]|uniref:hypothetical protein n=1 Tax=Streptomyces sp. NPDC048434 TaxID=3365549 RepID=UPI00371ACC13